MCVCVCVCVCVCGGGEVNGACYTPTEDDNRHARAHTLTQGVIARWLIICPSTHTEPGFHLRAAIKQKASRHRPPHPIIFQGSTRGQSTECARAPRGFPQKHAFRARIAERNLNPLLSIYIFPANYPVDTASEPAAQARCRCFVCLIRRCTQLPSLNMRFGL